MLQILQNSIKSYPISKIPQNLVKSSNVPSRKMLKLTKPHIGAKIVYFMSVQFFLKANSLQF